MFGKQILDGPHRNSGAQRTIVTDVVKFLPVVPNLCYNTAIYGDSSPSGVIPISEFFLWS